MALLIKVMPFWYINIFPPPHSSTCIISLALAALRVVCAKSQVDSLAI